MTALAGRGPQAGTGTGASRAGTGSDDRDLSCVFSPGKTKRLDFLDFYQHVCLLCVKPGGAKTHVSAGDLANTQGTCKACGHPLASITPSTLQNPTPGAPMPSLISAAHRYHKGMVHCNQSKSRAIGDQHFSPSRKTDFMNSERLQPQLRRQIIAAVWFSAAAVGALPSCRTPRAPLSLSCPSSFTEANPGAVPIDLLDPNKELNGGTAGAEGCSSQGDALWVSLLDAK